MLTFLLFQQSLTTYLPRSPPHLTSPSGASEHSITQALQGHSSRTSCPDLSRHCHCVTKLPSQPQPPATGRSSRSKIQRQASGWLQESRAMGVPKLVNHGWETGPCNPVPALLLTGAVPGEGETTLERALPRVVGEQERGSWRERANSAPARRLSPALEHVSARPTSIPETPGERGARTRRDRAGRARRNQRARRPPGRARG